MKFAVITGSGTGIGRALAIELINRNYQVLAVARREHNLQQLQLEYPDNVEYVTQDVATKQGRLEIAKAVNGRKIDFLVHNAAIIKPLNDLITITEEDWEKIFSVNVTAPLFLTKELLTSLHGGRVLQVGSAAAHHSVPGISAYCASKAALYNIYLSLKRELLPHGIAVGSIDPGVVDTPMQYVVRMNENKIFHGKTKRHPLILNPNIVAKFIAWILSDTNSQQFSEKEWNIYDTFHHSEWLSEELKAVYPLPEDDPILHAKMELDLKK